MSPSNTISITVSFQTGTATSTINALNKMIASIGQGANNASNQATAAFESIDKSLRNLQRSVAALGLGKLIQELLQAGDELYRIQRAFADQKGGAEVFAQFSEAAKQAGIDIINFAKSANLLRNAGVPLKEITRDVQALAMATRLHGGDQEAVNKSIQTMANLYAKGFATGRELFTGFVNTGLLPMKLLTDATGLSINKLRTDLRNLNVDNLMKVLVYQAQQSNAGKNLDDLTAATNKVKTAFDELGLTVMKLFGPSLGKLISLITDLINGFNELLKWMDRAGALPDWLKDLVVWVIALAAGITALAAAIKLFQAVNLLETLTALASSAVFWEIIAALTVIAGILYSINAYQESIKKGSGFITGMMSKAEADKARNNLFNPDEKAIENANTYASNLLNEAHKRYYLAGKESIEALTYVYNVHYEKVKASAEAVAKWRIAREIDVATEVRKHTEEVTKEILKLQEERFVSLRKIAVASRTMEPDDTAAGRVENLRIELEEMNRQVTAQATLKQAETARLAQQQIAAANKLGYYSSAKQYESDYQRWLEESNLNLNAKLAANRIQSEKDQLAVIRQYEQQQAEALFQDRLAALRESQQVQEAVLGLAHPLGPAAQIQQINSVAAARQKAIRDTQKEQLNFLETQQELFKQQHPYSDSSTFEKEQEFARQRIRINDQAETAIQLDRINAWREANAIIMEEQMRVYNSIKEALDKVWDAALDRSQSFWKALGEIIKSTILNALKEIVTSRLAAMFAGMFGYGTYQQRGGGPFDITQPPGPGGMGNPPTGTERQTSSSQLITSTAGGWLNQTLGQLARDAQASPGSSATTPPFVPAGLSEATSSMQGSADRMADPSIPEMIHEAQSSPQAQAAKSSAASGPNSVQRQVASLKESFSIGKPITLPTGQVVPWASATATQRLGSVLQSKGMGSLAAAVGIPIAMRGFAKPGGAAAAQQIGGGALAGAGIAQMFGRSPIGGAILGAGVGLMGAGWAKGGAVGMLMDIGGGALAGMEIGSMFGPGGALIGAAIGAGVGLAEGVARLFIHTQDEKIRAGIKRIYGIDIPDQGIRKQIADLANQKYGGNLSIALYSQEVQNLVRLYSIATGQNARLPRPMYGASLQQGGGGVQLQPVYSNGQLVQNPYTGTTTQDWASAGLYVQLDPVKANQLFTGQVVNVMQNNPGTVAQANAAATRSGNARDAQRLALMEPLTVPA